MSSLLSLRDITVGYGDETIIENINIELGGGEFCALLGLNGSGKTTLLKAVCGLIPMRRGSCFVNGHDCTNLGERKRARYISFIPQRHSIMQGVSVFDAVLMGFNPQLGLFEMPTNEHRGEAITILTKFGLSEYIYKDFSTLSEGQQQLVILARTLVQSAPVMLMDEPDSALDFLNRHKMQLRISDIIHYGNKAGIITLHDPNFALMYCDKIILLKDGRTVGEFSVKDSTREHIEECLSQIYGDISIIEHKQKYIMLQE